MTARRIGWIFLGLFVVTLSLGGVAWWATRQVPDFYEEVLKDEPQPEVRREEARKFVEQTEVLARRVQSEEEWRIDFTDRQINSWLAEELPKRFASDMPPGMSNPRVKVGDGVLLLGFRYVDSGFNGVVSFRLRPRIVSSNEVAIEIESFRAGLLPIPIESIVKEVVQRIPQDDWQVVRRDEEGKEVVFVKYVRPKRKDPRLESITLDNGSIRISGKSNHDDQKTGTRHEPAPHRNDSPSPSTPRLLRVAEEEVKDPFAIE